MSQFLYPTRWRDTAPIKTLREATKWVVGPLAKTLTGRAWKRLHQGLRAQASKLPHHAYLDTELMAAAAAELSQLNWEIRILLEAHRLEPSPGQLAGIRRRGGKLADYLLKIYRLRPGEAPQLERLATGKLSIFVSYSRHDWEQYAQPLVSHLRQAGFTVWVDQHLLRGGQDWLDEINRALDACDCLVLCVSPAALDSKYVKMEYRYFVEEDKPLIPVICRQTELPAELRGIQYVQYSDSDELVARLTEL